jgi:hypothetical protein
MNWRRGFFRLWVAASILWAVTVVGGALITESVVIKRPDTTVYVGKNLIAFPPEMSEYDIREAIKKALDEKQIEEGLILPGWENQVRFPKPTWLQAAPYLAMLIFGPSIGLLLGGLVVVWIVRGFRPV